MFTNDELNPQRPSASRRSFLTGSAKAIGGGAALMAFSGVLANPKAAKAATSDLDILNYALTLEHLEAAFYVQGLNKLTAVDFTSAKFIRGFGGQIISQVYKNLELIRDHEVAHVKTLITVIESLGGTPVKAATYNFGYANADGFIDIAQALENTGVSAYDGAIALIENPGLQTAGATIATVEARHAAYLNLLNGEVPFPLAFDEPKSMAEILKIAGQFIVS